MLIAILSISSDFGCGGEGVMIMKNIAPLANELRKNWYGRSRYEDELKPP